MSNTIGERVAAYLDLNRTEILASWMGKVIVYNNDPHKDLVRMNGSLMLDMLIASAKGIDIDDEKLRELSHKVSYERVQSNVNMGDYAYNIAVGRSEIFDHLPKIGEPLEDLFPVFSRFSVLFDKFLYFAGHHYTELKNQQLLEQSSFIEKTHQDKLTILGQMSSSFVHEFRNPLTSIIGFVQLLRDKYPSLEYIDILTMELNQLKFRITQFLLLSKRGADLKKKELSPYTWCKFSGRTG